MTRAAGLFALAIIGLAVVFQVTAALTGAILAAAGLDPYATDGAADLAGLVACALLLVAFYIRRAP